MEKANVKDLLNSEEYNRLFKDLFAYALKILYLCTPKQQKRCGKREIKHTF